MDITEEFRACNIPGMPGEVVNRTASRVRSPSDGQILLAASYDLSEAVCSVDVHLHSPSEATLIHCSSR